MMLQICRFSIRNTTIGRTVDAAILFHPFPDIRQFQTLLKPSSSILSFEVKTSSSRWPLNWNSWAENGLLIRHAIPGSPLGPSLYRRFEAYLWAKLPQKSYHEAYFLANKAWRLKLHILSQFSRLKYVQFLFYLRYLSCWVNSHRLCSAYRSMLFRAFTVSKVCLSTSWSWALCDAGQLEVMTWLGSGCSLRSSFFDFWQSSHVALVLPATAVVVFSPFWIVSEVKTSPHGHWTHGLWTSTGSVPRWLCRVDSSSPCSWRLLRLELRMTVDDDKAGGYRSHVSQSALR